MKEGCKERVFRLEVLFDVTAELRMEGVRKQPVWQRK